MNRKPGRFYLGANYVRYLLLWLVRSIVLFNWIWPRATAATELNLPLPDELFAAPTPFRRLDAVVRDKEFLYLFQAESLEYARMPFNPAGKTREERFGKYVDVQRIKYPATKIPGEWRGFITPSKVNQLERQTFWDASMLQFVQVQIKDGSIIQENSAPNDVIRPPRDRLGEPTVLETRKARKAFKEKYRKVFGAKYTGMARLPKGWHDQVSKDHYLFATKIEDYPVTVLSCDPSDSVACQLDRFCYLEGGPKVLPPNVAGVGVFLQGKAKRILLGDSSKNQIQVYNWNSCFDVRYLFTINLPKLNAKLTSLFTDDDLLFITTDKWDSRFDSNLFYWEMSRYIK